MNKSILQRFFEEEVNVRENMEPRTHEYHEVSKSIDDESEYFRGMLTGEALAHFDNLEEQQNYAKSLLQYHSFAYGFRLATNFIMDSAQGALDRND